MGDGTASLHGQGQTRPVHPAYLFPGMVLSQFTKVQPADTIVLAGLSDAVLSEFGFFGRS